MRAKGYEIDSQYMGRHEFEAQRIKIGINEKLEFKSEGKDIRLCWVNVKRKSIVTEFYNKDWMRLEYTELFPELFHAKCGSLTLIEWDLRIKPDCDSRLKSKREKR